MSQYILMTNFLSYYTHFFKYPDHTENCDYGRILLFRSYSYLYICDLSRSLFII